MPLPAPLVAPATTATLPRRAFGSGCQGSVPADTRLRVGPACEIVLLVASAFARDDRGRTSLFSAAEQGQEGEVRRIIFSLAGTGFAPQRLALIAVEDNEGLTAADVAEQAGHHEIAELLRGEQARMEFFE